MSSEDAGLVSGLSLNTEPPADQDTVPDVETVFRAQYQEAGSLCLGLEHCSVLGLTETGGGQVVGLTHTGRLTSYDPELLVSTWDLGPGEDRVRAVASHGTEPHLVLSCGESLKVWDLREAGRPVLELRDSSKLGPLQFSCLAASRAGLVVAGTEQQGLDSFLLFWDLKAGGQELGGYWSVHSDDVTSLQFHSQSQHRLLTGSTDGLVNILDLSKPEEEEALLSSYNSLDSVAEARWRGQGEEVVVRTHTEALQTWSPSTSRHQTFTRADLAGGIRRAVEDHVYIVGLEVEEEEVEVVAGSRYIPSPCLRSLSLTDNGDLQPQAHFIKAGPSTRCCLRLKQSNSFVTGGEDGVIRIWRKVDGESAPASSQDSTRKIATNDTSKTRKKPYAK